MLHILRSFVALSSIHPSKTCALLAIMRFLNPLVCRATEFDLQGYWCIRSLYYYYLITLQLAGHFTEPGRIVTTCHNQANMNSVIIR